MWARLLKALAVLLAVPTGLLLCTMAAQDSPEERAQHQAELEARIEAVCVPDRAAAWSDMQEFIDSWRVTDGVAEVFVNPEFWSRLPFGPRQGLSEWIVSCLSTDEPVSEVRWRHAMTGSVLATWDRAFGYRSME